MNAITTTVKPHVTYIAPKPAFRFLRKGIDVVLVVQCLRLKEYMDIGSHSFGHIRFLVCPRSEEFHDLIEDHLKSAGYRNSRIPARRPHQVLIAKL
jgi:hypothetical protein